MGRGGPITDLELVDHGCHHHAHLVLLQEAVEVAKHVLVYRCRRRGRRRKARVLGFGEERRGEERSRDLKPWERNSFYFILGKVHFESLKSRPNLIRTPQLETI